MSVSVEEVLEHGGYNVVTDVEDAKWLLSRRDEVEELLDKADELVDDQIDYEDFIDMQENDLGIHDNPTFEEWRKERHGK